MNKVFERYKQVYFIREFEELLFKLFEKGKLSGTIHTSIGQEANAVGVAYNLRSNDIIFSSHRCHGHYLAHKGEPYPLLREIMGESDGVCGGIGGSQHICNPFFFSNGVQGSYMPIIVGMAYAEKYFYKTDRIITGFIGDGTLGQGTVYESLNMASLYDVPLLLIIENNKFAQSTPIDKNLAGSIAKRIEAFDIRYNEITSTDVDVIYDNFRKIVKYVRDQKKPFVSIVNTYRLAPHSKGDDTRDLEYFIKNKKYDPISIIESKISSTEKQELKYIVNKEIQALMKKAGVL